MAEDLPSAAVEVLRELPRLSDWVLPGDNGRRAGEHGPYAGLGKSWERVRARADLVNVRLNDLRHSFASFAVADGQSLFIVGKLLGHKQTRTTERYAHLAADPLLAAVERTAECIVTATIGGASVSDNASQEPS